MVNAENFLVKTLVAATALFFAQSCGRSNVAQEAATLTTQGPFVPQSEVTKHVQNAGFQGWEIHAAAAIAECESSNGLRSFAYGAGNRHTGLFQISDIHRSFCGYGNLSVEEFRSKMTSPSLNAQCARKLYVRRGDFNDWDCFYFGSYKKYLR
ncbi:hypothetical protein EBU99_00460 [bacterium]|nr:hypothetical protein [bacterium]